MNNLKKFLYLFFIVFLYGSSVATSANFTVQVINDEIEDADHPKFGKVTVQVSFTKDGATIDQQTIEMSGWPRKQTAWRVTIPTSLETGYTSVCYRFQVDTGERLSESGGIIVNESLTSPHLTDITASIKRTHTPSLLFA